MTGTDALFGQTSDSRIGFWLRRPTGRKWTTRLPAIRAGTSPPHGRRTLRERSRQSPMQSDEP